MSKNGKKLTELEIRELFKKYDANDDKEICEKELTEMVTDIYLLSHNLKELQPNDLIIIQRSVEELMKIKDINKDGKLQFDEFNSNHEGNNIIQTTGIHYLLYYCQYYYLLYNILL